MRKGARLGQHFLKNPHYAEVLAREAQIKESDTVLEIGPGEGMLTAELLKHSGRVIAVEKDEALVEKISARFSVEIQAGKLLVVSSDIRDFNSAEYGLSAGGYVVAANIPYYITGELLRKFLESSVYPRTIAFLMQKEVALRILSEKESILSISVKVYGAARVAAKVSAGNFNPPPQVDSAILVVEKISKENFISFSETDFFAAVRAGFSSKRKQVANNLAVEFGKDRAEAALKSCGVAPEARAEDLHLPVWLALAKELNR